MKLVDGNCKVFSKYLPSVSLIKGIVSEDARMSLISGIVSNYNIREVDTLTVPSLSSESSGYVHKFCTTSPFGDFKLANVNLDGSSGRVQNSLLRLLENSSNKLKFVLFSTSEVLNTLESRSQIFVATEDVLLYSKARGKVLEALKCCLNRDRLALDKIFNTWDETAHLAFTNWAIEAVSGRYNIFSREDIEGLRLLLPYAKGIFSSLLSIRESRYSISDYAILLSLLENLR